MKITERDRLLMGLTVYGEARGEDRVGKTAVAWTILHRAANPRWWGRDPASCCMARWQYSCWNHADPNRKRLLALLSDGETTTPRLTGDGERVLRECLEIVDAVCAGTIPDPTGGATHYFNPQAVASPPGWSAGRSPSATIGDHVFYAGVEPGVRPAVMRPPPDADVASPVPQPAASGGLFSWLMHKPRRKA